MEQFEQFKQNYVMFNSYLSADPEVKYFENGKVVCKFALPLKKNKNDEALWLNCETWSNALAEIISEKYKKGSEITVMGYLKETEYNEKKYVKFVVKMAM